MTKTEKETFKNKNRPDRNIKGNKYVKKRLQKANDQDMEGDEANESIDEVLIEYSKEDAIKDIAFLRSCKLNDANMPVIREKIKLTVDERSKMVNDDKTNLLEKFPYFFAEPKLVCH